MRGVRGVKGVALDVQTSAATVANFQQQMMRRFKMMEQTQVNNIYKIKDIDVDYFEIFGQRYQFDEMFELTVDIDENDRNYSKLIMIYPNGRIPKIISIEEIYNGLQNDEFSNPQLPQVKGYNSYIDKSSIRKTTGKFKPKALIFLADELNELMTSDDYKSVDTVKQALGSIARLGRAAGVHLALAAQRASGNTISSDLKNNIQMSVLLGGFDSGASTLMFEKDISNLAKPEIKGRCFLQSGNDIIETQSYYTDPVDDWVFDEQQRLTYDNPIYIEQKEKKKEVIDDSGFIMGNQQEELSNKIKDEDNNELDDNIETFLDDENNTESLLFDEEIDDNLDNNITNNDDEVVLNEEIPEKINTKSKLNFSLDNSNNNKSIRELMNEALNEEKTEDISKKQTLKFKI